MEEHACKLVKLNHTLNNIKFIMNGESVVPPIQSCFVFPMLFLTKQTSVHDYNDVWISYLI